MKRTFFQFLGYYLLASLLPLLCIIPIYHNDMVEKTSIYLQSRAESETQGVMRSLESHLSIIHGYPAELFHNGAVTAYRYDSTPLKRRSLIMELERMVGGNNLIVNLFVYFRDTGTFVSAYSNSWSRQSVLEGNILIYDTIPAHTFVDMIGTLSHEQVLPAEVVLPTLQAQKCEVITFLDTLPTNNRFAYASTITLLNAAKLRELLQSGGADAYLLLDATGQVILSHASEGLSQHEILACLPAGHSGTQYVTLAGQESVLSVCRSASYGYTLVRITSMQPLVTEQNRIISHVTVILCFLSGLIALSILFFMRRTFTPIRELAALALRSGSRPAQEDTAFALIRSALHSFETENMQLSTQLQKQSPLLAEYAVRTLLSTPEEHWNQQAYEVCLGVGLRLTCSAYRVIVLQFDDTQQQLQALQSMLEACGAHYVASFPEALQNRIVLLLGYSATDNSPQESLVLDAVRFQAAGLGPIVQSVRNWNASYIRASLACDFAADTHEPGCIKRFEEITTQLYASSYPWEALQMLFAAMNQSNTSMVRTAGEQLQAYLRRSSLSCADDVRSVFNQIMKICLDALPEHKEAIARYICMYRLEEVKATGQAMADCIGEFLCAFCCREDGERAHRENSPIYHSLSIIREEIGSEHLSLAYVAERVGLSPSRYSALFPQEMNRNFKEYVDSLRLNLAKQLLRTTTLQVGIVAAQVGYRNAYSFTRFFKAKIGLTPIEYRESLKSTQ